MILNSVMFIVYTLIAQYWLVPGTNSRAIKSTYLLLSLALKQKVVRKHTIP